MSMYPAAFERLVEQLGKLPGVGSKSAQRMAFYFLGLRDEEAEAFARAITDAKREVHRCKICQNLTDSEVCPICTSAKRDQSTICVVSDTWQFYLHPKLPVQHLHHKEYLLQNLKLPHLASSWKWLPH